MVRLWIREDGEQPKALPGDVTAGPGPGAVVDVQARSSREAREVYARATAADVSEETDPQGWLAQRAARKRITTVRTLARMRGDA